MRETIYGYIRVSTLDQNEDRQLRALRQRGVPMQNIYMDKRSRSCAGGTCCTS